VLRSIPTHEKKKKLKHKKKQENNKNKSCGAVAKQKLNLVELVLSRRKQDRPKRMAVYCPLASVPTWLINAFKMNFFGGTELFTFFPLAFIV